jgi:hypothetical protein
MQEEEKEEEAEEIRDGAHESFGVFDTRYRWLASRPRPLPWHTTFIFYDE